MWGRSTGNSAATFVNWMFNLAVSMSFLSLTEVLTKEGEYRAYDLESSGFDIENAFILVSPELAFPENFGVT